MRTLSIGLVATLLSTALGVVAVPPAGALSLIYDHYPPAISVTATPPATVGVGQLFMPPSIAVTDDVAWHATDYAATVDWGDGNSTAVSFPGISTPSASVSITLPPHIYVLPGSFEVSVTVADPARHAITAILTTATIVPALAPGTGNPRLVGIPRVGRTLTCEPGDWGDTNAEIEVRWKANGKRIPSFSDDTFHVRRRDQGRRLTCQVIQRNAAFVARATSNALRIRSMPPLDR